MAYIATGVASFGASWVAVLRSMKSKTASPADLEGLRETVKELREDVKRLSESNSRLEEAQKNSKENAAMMQKRQDRMDDQLRRTVTDEEFAAYTRQTTDAVNGLTQSVGRAIGILDANASRS